MNWRGLYVYSIHVLQRKSMSMPCSLSLSHLLIFTPFLSLCPLEFPWINEMMCVLWSASVDWAWHTSFWCAFFPSMQISKQSNIISEKQSENSCVIYHDFDILASDAISWFPGMLHTFALFDLKFKALNTLLGADFQDWCSDYINGFHISAFIIEHHLIIIELRCNINITSFMYDYYLCKC